MILSILIPTLNEEINIRKLLPCLHEVMTGVLPKSEYEIVIADARSEDNIEQVVKDNNAKLVVVSRGYGIAIANGIKACRGKYIITMDADFSHSPYIVPILFAARHQAEVLIASRYIKNGFSQSGFFRQFLSWILNTFYRVALNLPIRDLSSGFRLYHKRIFDEVAPTEVNYVVLQEILIKAYSRGFRVKEVPFHYHPRKHGFSKSRILAFGKDYLRSLFKFWRLRNSHECADYDERAFNSRFYFQRIWQKRRYSIICDYAREYRAILDIGCGSSQILDGLPQAVGMDLQMNMLRYKRAPHKILIRGDIRHIPFANGVFEATIASQVIEHLPRNPVILDEVLRVTKPGGFIIIGTPDYSTRWRIIEWFYQLLHPSGYADKHPSHWTRRELFREMEKRGCSLCGYEYIFGAELIAKFQKKTEPLPQ